MRTTIFRKAGFIPFVLILLLISSFSHGFEADSAQSSIILTTDIASAENQEIFSPYDTVYALVTLTGIPPGKYIADISWVNSSGTMNQYSPVSLSIAPNSPFTFYSWLRLLKNSPLKSTMTGKTFSADSLGKWVVTVSIEDIFFKTVEFEIQ
ncbi:MAG: hypothetical protein JKY62_04560 [Desulfocapsa sp.]|uniref:Uncharacterized protein n=1 Tax=Desulfotalea psychrophila TaxID=84980 RepID=A0ABS3ATW9_9BACT|nr:hypothetical protein [Desulfocapsa sp.]MBN4068534.1 hypothetical protein [Desulfotalea psychrophila]